MRIEFALYDESSVSVSLDDESEVVSDASSSVDADSNSEVVGTESEIEGSAASSDYAGVDSSSVSESGSVADSSSVGVVSEVRPILTTPLDDYSVTEGLLLIVVLILALGGILSMFRGR